MLLLLRGKEGEGLTLKKIPQTILFGHNMSKTSATPLFDAWSVTPLRLPLVYA